MTDPNPVATMLGSLAGKKMANETVLTTVQCAELLQVHPKVVGRYVKSRGLPAHRIGREFRFLQSEVIAWIASLGARQP